MNLILSLPQNSKGFVTPIPLGDEISEFNTDKKRLWVEILNKSIEEPIKIKKNQPLGLIVIEPEHLKFKYEFEFKTVKKRRSYESKKIQTTWRLP